MVIYHGRKSWKNGNSMAPLCALVKRAKAYVPNYKGIMFSLWGMSDQHITGDIQARAFLLTLKYARSSAIREKMPDTIHLFDSAQEMELEYLRVILLYLAHVMGRGKRELFLGLLQKHTSDRGGYMKTIADELSKMA